MVDEARSRERLPSVPKQMAKDFRSWHVWNSDKAVYREIYTRTVSGLIIAVVAYFFVALGTSMNLDPIGYFAWAVSGVSALFISFGTYRFVRSSISRIQQKINGASEMEILALSRRMRREAVGIRVALAMGLITYVAGVFLLSR
ncbi:hypothetical protein ACFRJ9_07045 [Paenarthrobacter sp. NPDC056912]|uniref:hypothetical protein n=1 Tax=Paenarthrobacter sp. NPDC056912 TaxID=3345965 RepID=UPI003671CBA7